MKPIVIKEDHTKTPKQRILEILFNFPNEEFSLTDLAKKAKIAKSNIGSILKGLEELKFIEITRLSNLWRIKANQIGLNFIRSKIIYNLDSIYKSGLIEFLENHFKNPKSIILFGSVRKGEDISKSDIDIAIESDDFKKYEVKELNELSEFEKIFEKNIQLHLFNKKNVDINVFNNIANGIILSGFLEVKK